MDKEEKKPKFNMHMSEEEKVHLKAFAKEHGKSSIAKLIRASLEVVQRNPSLIEPTEEHKPTKEILESLEKSYLVFDYLNETLLGLQKKIENLQRFQEWTVTKLGASDKELKELQQKDLSHEAVFE